MQKPVMVEQGDTPEVLQRRIMEQAEWKILPETINLIANGKVHVDGRVVTIDKQLCISGIIPALALCFAGRFREHISYKMEEFR